MPLVKKHIADRDAHGAVVLDLGDLQRHADRIMAQAREEAAAIVSKGTADAQKMIDRASALGQDTGYEAGFRKGRTEGSRQGAEEALAERREQLAGVDEAWTDALVRFEHDRGLMLASAREDVLALALEIARKIVLRVPALDPTVVVDQLSEALEFVAEPSRLAIEVHPADRAIVEEALPKFTTRIAAAAEARLIDNDAIDRGGLVVHTEHGRIDATLEKQLDRLVSSLLPDATAPPGSAS